MGPRWYCETSEALFASQNRQHTHCFNSVIHCVSPSVCTAWTSWSTRLQLTSDRVLNSWSDGDQSWLCLAIVASIPRLPTTSLIRWRCHSVARFCPYHWACKDWFPRVAVWSHAAAVRPQFILLFLRWASGSRKSRGFSFFPAFLTQSRHGSTGVFFCSADWREIFHGEMCNSMTTPPTVGLQRSNILVFGVSHLKFHLIVLEKCVILRG